MHRYPTLGRRLIPSTLWGLGAHVHCAFAPTTWCGQTDADAPPKMPGPLVGCVPKMWYKSWVKHPSPPKNGFVHNGHSWWFLGCVNHSIWVVLRTWLAPRSRVLVAESKVHNGYRELSHSRGSSQRILGIWLVISSSCLGFDIVDVPFCLASLNFLDLLLWGFYLITHRFVYRQLQMSTS